MLDSVLIYDFEFVLQGDTLPRPVNYALVRVLPPAGVELDERKRPVVVIDLALAKDPVSAASSLSARSVRRSSSDIRSISSASQRNRWTASVSRMWRARTPCSSKRYANCTPIPRRAFSSATVRPAGTRSWRPVCAPMSSGRS